MNSFRLYIKITKQIMCIVEYACTIYIATVYYFQLSLFVQLCYIVMLHCVHSLNITPSLRAPSPFAFNILNEKSICPTVIFFQFSGQVYIHVHKQNLKQFSYCIFFCVYRSSKFTQFTILVNMSKLCNYIIIHTQKHTRLYIYIYKNNIYKNHLCTYS